MDRSADRRLVICKKFISTFKKEGEPKGPGCPPTTRMEVRVGGTVGGQAPKPPSCPTRGRGRAQATDSLIHGHGHGLMGHE
jgi:hypothetical protein